MWKKSVAKAGVKDAVNKTVTSTLISGYKASKNTPEDFYQVWVPTPHPDAWGIFSPSLCCSVKSPMLTRGDSTRPPAVSRRSCFRGFSFALTEGCEHQSDGFFEALKALGRLVGTYTGAA